MVGRRIFVVGVPRSGTTLVQSLLAAHSEVTSFTESHFFSRHFKPLPVWPWAILRKDPTSRLRQFLLENGVGSPGSDPLETFPLVVPSRWRLPLAAEPVASRLLLILDGIALSHESFNWVEKTPGHLRFVPFLERLCAHSSFVHVIREGPATVASLHAASQNWERPYDLDTCVTRWNVDVRFSLGRVPPRGSKRNAGRPNDHFVFYEQLTSRPEATLKRLLAGLELDWQPEILERYDSSRLITREETWKAGVDGGVRRSRASEQSLTEEQRDRVRTTLRHDLYTRLLERTS